MKRRSFVESALSAAMLPSSQAAQLRNHSRTTPPNKPNVPGHIPNEYSLLLPGEREALSSAPNVKRIKAGSVHIEDSPNPLRPGGIADGWQLLAVVPMNGSETAVFERHVTHQGAMIFITEAEGVILRIPKQIGKLSSIRPRPTNSPHGVEFTRKVPYTPRSDVCGDYILHSNQDPCYENVAALGAEYIGYTLVANEQAGPLRSLFLEANGKSRQLSRHPEGQGIWAPDLTGALFDPAHFLPGGDPSVYRYLPGYSKRTLLGGFLPVADIAVWNPESRAGYEVMVVLPEGVDAQPVARIRAIVPPWMASQIPATHSIWKSSEGILLLEHYWNTSPQGFFSALAGVANYWQHFFEDHMDVDIPDPWLLNAARAGITLSRCSYRGLEPTYQIGEGAYTKIPERSHALFPVAHYEFVWAQQLWNLTGQVEPYFQHYLDRYILPDGNFLYNTQDQVEAPLNAGVFLWNSARAYDYTRNIENLNRRLPVLRRMIDFVLQRFEYSKSHFPPTDRRHGLIWGSPEADLGDPQNDFPNSHPYYFQNSTWIWRGLKEHARCLDLAAREHNLPDLGHESQRISAIAVGMRALIEQSLKTTIAAADAAMRDSGITPFSPDDIHHNPTELASYENHRFMMDWFTADWGAPALDLGHLKHRELAGQQVMGLHTDGNLSRTSNFMAHGTLAVRIRQDDYRPFLLTLYSLCCYAADCGNRYSPEDAYLPGSFPGDGSPYAWSAVVNSVLQPTVGLRWLLCYEESDRDICHIQKAAPKHWFKPGESIRVSNCPTRFGHLSWHTRCTNNSQWSVTIDVPNGFTGALAIHIHPPDDRPLRSATSGRLQRNVVLLETSDLQGKQRVSVQIQ